jgi:restriction system protein
MAKPTNDFMKGRNEMARRNKNGETLEAVVGVTALMPWWVGVVLAVASYLWLHGVASAPMPTKVTPDQVSGLIFSTWWRGISMVGQFVLPGLFLVGAVGSYLKRRQAAQLHSDAANRADGISQMSWRDFEVMVGEYFRRQGFAVAGNGGGGPDGGVDLWLTRGADRYLEPVREMYGLIAAQRLAGGYVVTSGEFTDEARRFAQGRELQLVNGAALKRGVQAQAAAGAERAGRASPAAAAMPETPRQPTAAASMPACPNCGAAMTLRVARQGANAGKQFWGCSQFAQTKCRGVRELV